MYFTILANKIDFMDSLTKAIVTFVLTYFVSLVTRAALDKEKEQRSIADGLKDKSNHKMASIIALVIAVSSYYL